MDSKRSVNVCLFPTKENAWEKTLFSRTEAKELNKKESGDGGTPKIADRIILHLTERGNDLGVYE